MEKGNKPVSVDEYIESAPESVRPMLKDLQKVIKTSAPKSVEAISYGMPYYSYHGRLVYFMAHKSILDSTP
jgi:uncharacterized protein YdhG (YjbR/CyaY superfamily)